MRTLQGKVALVTGSSRGIGAAIAKRFALNGARVALHGRDTSTLAEVANEIARDGGTSIQTTGDITCFDDLESIRRRVESELGPIDILVANAGGNFAKMAPIDELDESEWRATVDGNLTATFLTIKSILPGMKQRGAGTVITISSAAARRAHPRSPIAYAAAKAGIQMLTQHVATQVGPLGIRVNCIAPETILTERNARQIPAAQQTALIDAHPIRRLGTPDDVALAALFLASDESAWITGVVLDVAGGAVMV